MNTNYSDLKNKTFLDFTNDESIIDEIIGANEKTSFVENLSDYGRYITFIQFAEITNDKELADEVENQLGNINNEQ